MNNNLFNDIMAETFGSTVGVTITKGVHFVRLKSKPANNLYVFLLLIVLVFPLYFLLAFTGMTETDPSGALLVINVYLALTVLITLTYRKVFDFSNGRMSMYRTALGLKWRRTVSYRDISLVLLKTVFHSSIASVTHPVMVKEYRLELHTSGGKKIKIDQAADYMALSSLGTAIKKVTQARYNET